MSSKHVTFVCEKCGPVTTTFATARVECGKCKTEVAPEGTTLKEHHKFLKSKGRL